MNRFLPALAGVCALVAASPAAHAVTIDISTAILSGGAKFQDDDSKIKFAPNEIGQADFTLDSVPGTQYVISVTGQNNQSQSFFQFFIDADGPGAGGFVQLGGNINFGSGFNTIALLPFTDIGNTDFFRIVSGGTGNTEGHIDALSSISINQVPGPIAGAGLPGLVLACGGLIAFARRRRQQMV
jgi:hypothetical protein